MPSVMLPGEVGRLEGKYVHNASMQAPLAVILHPNSLQGGTMNSKVVQALYKAFIKAGCSTLRFNFRGVGLSEGEYSNGIGELNDAMMALNWLHKINPGERKIWIAGYSFGALIGMQLLMRRPELKGFVSVCPPANIYDFSFLAPCPVSGMVINGEDDVICPIEHVDKLVDKLSAQKGLDIRYKILQGCGHTFDNKLDELQKTVLDYISARNLDDDILDIAI